jgi:hypothetical protein
MILGRPGYIAHALIRRSAAIYEKTVNSGSGGFRSRHRGPLSDALQEDSRHENEACLKLLAGRAEQKARADFAVEKEFLETQLDEEQRKCREAQQAELELRKGRDTVEACARELDLEVARRVDGEKQRLAEQQDLRLKEKDKLIEGLRTALEEARRKSE